MSNRGSWGGWHSLVHPLSAGLWGQGMALIRSAPQGTKPQEHILYVATVGPSVHGAPLPKVTIPIAGLMVQTVCLVPNDSSYLLPYKPYTASFTVSHHTGQEIEVAEEQKHLPFSWP